MKCFTVGKGAVAQGISVSSSPFLHIGLGESGRGRKYTHVPLNQNDFGVDTKEIKRCSVVRSKGKGSLLIITEKDSSDNRVLVRVDIPGGFRGSNKLDIQTPELCQEIASGYGAEGAAGRAGGPHYDSLFIMSPGAQIKVTRYGRLYGAESERCIRWTGSELQLGTEAELDRLDPEKFEENIDWIPANFRIKQLSGNSVSDGVTLENGKLTRSNFDAQELMAHGFGVKEEGEVELQQVRFGRHSSGDLVIAPMPEGEEVEQDYEAVLVREYSPGCGAKRWPSFSIDWANAGDITKLASVARTKGSGSDYYTLAVVPAGWAENIAAQFVDERDEPDQTIAYKPGLVPPTKPQTDDDDYEGGIGRQDIDVEAIRDAIAF